MKKRADELKETEENQKIIDKFVNKNDYLQKFICTDRHNTSVIKSLVLKVYYEGWFDGKQENGEEQAI